MDTVGIRQFISVCSTPQNSKQNGIKSSKATSANFSAYSSGTAMVASPTSSRRYPRWPLCRVLQPVQSNAQDAAGEAEGQFIATIHQQRQRRRRSTFDVAKIEIRFILFFHFSRNLFWRLTDRRRQNLKRCLWGPILWKLAWIWLLQFMVEILYDGELHALGWARVHEHWWQCDQIGPFIGFWATF